MNKVEKPERKLVLPGELVAEGEIAFQWSPYIIKIDNKLYSTVLGLAETRENKVNVIPLQGNFYYPKVGDLVIGFIKDVEAFGWIIDIKAPYSAYLPASNYLGRPANNGEDLTKYLEIGEYIIAKIEQFDRSVDPILMARGKGLGRITSGGVIDISTVKVPRVIGKGKAMLEMLAKETGCEILVAQNGRIWFQCPDKQREDVLLLSVYTIEKESHTKGLTDRIKQLIREKLGVEKIGEA